MSNYDKGRRAWRSVIAFALLGLLGPIIMLSLYEAIGVNKMTDQMAFLVWPTQMLAAYESSIGRVLALVLALVLNVMVFSAIGALIGRWAVTRIRIVGAYLLVVVAVFGWALWGAGLNIRFLDGLGLIASFGLYAMPFLFIAKFIPAHTI